MPRLIRTGYAGYCTAAARTFGAHVDDPDLETSFIAELFGKDRITADPTTRHRAWELRDSKNGRRNRRTIFQNTWLDKARRQSIYATSLAVDRLQGQIETVGAVEKWLKKQVDRIDRCLATRRVQADAAAYRTAVKDLLREIESIKGTLAQIAAPEKKLPKEHLLMIRDIAVDLATLRGGADELNQPALSAADLKAGLKLIEDSYLEPFEGKLSALKQALSGERLPLMEKLDKESDEAVCRDEAIENCVNAMMDDDSSLLWFILGAVGHTEFAQAFSVYVLPSIDEGFRAENYAKERIDGFHREIINALNTLETGTPGAKDHFRAFLTSLLTGLIYGPTSTGISQGTSYDDGYRPMDDNDLRGFIGDQIVLSHQLSPDGGLVGNTVTYDASTLIFIGRCGSSEVFLEALPELLPEDEYQALDLATKHPAVFSLPWAHTQVSNFHGMIVCEEGSWRYIDFSRYGTRLVGRGKDAGLLDSWFNHKTRELEPGQVLYLGAAENDRNARLYFRAAALKVSFHLDTDTVAAVSVEE